MGRSLGAVLAGYVLFALSAIALSALTHRTPEQSATPIYMTCIIVYGMSFGTLSGWVTARIVGRNETAHGLFLWLVITLAALGTFLFSPTFRWSQMLTMFMYAPMAVVGGVIREHQRIRAGA